MIRVSCTCSELEVASLHALTCPSGSKGIAGSVLLATQAAGRASRHCQSRNIEFNKMGSADHGIALRDLNLEDVILLHVSSQAREALSARAT